MITVRSISRPPRGSFIPAKSSIVSTTSPARSPHATWMVTSALEKRAIKPCSTVLPAPNGPGMHAVPPSGIGKNVSMSRIPVHSNASG